MKSGKIKWARLESDDHWRGWGYIPLCKVADLERSWMTEDIAYVLSKTICIDVGFHGPKDEGGWFSCCVVREPTDEDPNSWLHPLEEAEFKNGKDAYAWVNEMREKYRDE